LKIAITAKSKNLDADVDKVFGRCQYFIFLGIENGKIKNVEAEENKFKNQMGGAGISAAQFITEKGIKTIITGNVGPRALDVLKQFNIEIYNGSGKVKETVEKFINKKLEKMGV